MRTTTAKLFLTALAATLSLTTLASASALPGATPGPKTISDNGIHFIANFEGLRLKPYNDPVHCTVGIGHLISKYGCKDPRAAKAVARFLPSITQAQAYTLFRNDLQDSISCVNRAVTLPLTQGQFDALVSFAFNSGCTPTRKVATLINAGDLAGAAKEISEYVKGDVWVGPKGHRHKVKRTLQGLVKRRLGETQKVTGQVKSGKPTPTQKPLTAKNGTPIKLPKPPAVKIAVPQPDPGPSTSVTGKVIPKGSPTLSDPAPDSGGTPVGDCPIGAAALSVAVPAGCYQFTVTVTPSFLSTDPTNHFGFGRGGGRVVINPIGHTLSCNNVGESTCTYTADLPIGTTVTVTQTAMSITSSPAAPSDPPDSEFGKWSGACSGTGSCSFTLNANHMTAAATFVPALATLTVNAEGVGEGGAEVLVSPQRGGQPSGLARVLEHRVLRQPAPSVHGQDAPRRHGQPRRGRVRRHRVLRLERRPVPAHRLRPVSLRDLHGRRSLGDRAVRGWRRWGEGAYVGGGLGKAALMGWRIPEAPSRAPV